MLPSTLPPPRHATPPWLAALLPSRWWWLLACLTLAAVLGAATPARAAFIAYSGSGNTVLFDATSGDGGWVGAIDEVPGSGIVAPLSLVSTVLFRYDAASGTLLGSFEFTTAADLASSLFGSVSGRTLDADPFGSGGQFELDYLILGGNGVFDGASGFGLAFLDIDAFASGDNYRESGLLVFDTAAVPVPASLGLVALALALLVGSTRSAAPGAGSSRRFASDRRPFA